MAKAIGFGSDLLAASMSYPRMHILNPLVRQETCRCKSTRRSGCRLSPEEHRAAAAGSPPPAGIFSVQTLPRGEWLRFGNI
ncbi:hypothetical protein PILCRDRAFT_816723 [Piloderma croceum F 1598]|uniref:Uncharacterized protein n=1 Tax=Piloderma croceum (strain F 1598) TaxID=765440 RepID=A0A0C3FPX7_PILCF|nr:hypothetical protein PILCRDRAFT_816723 [Piloderma croceum F 1598]